MSMAIEARPIVKVRLATFPDDENTIRELFLAYEQFLLDYAAVKLDFQNFEYEVASLPGKYAVEQKGSLLLAYISTPATGNAPSKETPVGCMGLRGFLSPHSSEPSGELKRLFLMPESRGLGVSKLLMDATIARARDLGYKELLLDTLKSMKVARRLYEKYGFVQIDAYAESHPDAVFYRLDLTETGK